MADPKDTPDARVRAAVDDGEEFDDCPVKALGESVEGGRFFFLSKSGKVRAVTHRDLNRAGIDSLFVGDAGWLAEVCPQVDRKGKATGDWHADEARSELLRRCDAAGYFDPDRQIRGPGTWRDEDGGLIVHCGDRVLIGEAWRKAGFRLGRHIYPAYPRMMAPPAAPADPQEVYQLLDFLGRWNFRWEECGARLMLGWIFAALVCGALDWRPHIWVTGGRNHGKSTLEKLVFGIIGDMLFRASDPSGAGVRNTLNGAAMPVALDEVEFDPSNRRAQDCVELARLGSTDDQGAIVRATADGGSNSWYVRACFYFSSILHAPLKPQDRSRITVLELGPIKSGADKRYVRNEIERFRRLAPSFHARLIACWDVFQINLITYEEALSETFNYRVADQFGTLLAVADTMLCDEPSDPKEVAEFLTKLELEPHIDAGGIDDPDECLNRLMSWPADLWRSGERHTIGSLIDDAVAYPLGETRRVLPRLGIVLRPGRGIPEFLAVANHHNNIARVYQDTRFAHGGWSQILKQLPGAGQAQPLINFAGARSRAVMIPLEVIATPEGDGAAGPAGDPSGPPLDSDDPLNR